MTVDKEKISSKTVLLGVVVEGAAVLNRWSVTWKDLSRREEGEAVSEASTWRKNTAGRTAEQRPQCVCAACVSGTPRRPCGR